MTVIQSEDFTKDHDWLKVVNKVAVIGRGKCASKYHYIPNIAVFVINTALEFYPDANFVVMVEPHYKELKDLPLFADSNIILFHKKDYAKGKLVCGCTPSIFISFLIDQMKSGSTIYLQGFSMDEEKNLKYPSKITKNKAYDWARQIKAFQLVQDRARQKNIKLILIDENSKLPFITHKQPNKEDVQHA
jgi:hypothetical protein